MTTAEQSRVDEQTARARHRQLQKMQTAARRAQQKRWRQRLADAITDTRRAHPKCRCGLRSSMSRQELQALGGGCTPTHVCPRLDAVRRRLGL